MSTVGYGDRVPSTRCGQFIAVVWMIISLIFTASLTSITTQRISSKELIRMDHTIATLEARKGCMTFEKRIAKDFSENIVGCASYKDCLDMVESGKAMATFIDANVASMLQADIKKRELAIIHLHESPFPYWLFFSSNFMTNEGNDVERLVDCLDKLPHEAKRMIHNACFPMLRIQRAEVPKFKDLFTGPPYMGFITVSMIGFLVILGFLTEFISVKIRRKDNGTMDSSNTCHVHANEHSQKDVSSVEKNDKMGLEEQLKTMIQKNHEQYVQMLRLISQKRDKCDGQ